MTDLLTPVRAGAILGVSARRVLVLIAEGRLKAENIGGEGRAARYVLRRSDVEQSAATPRATGGRPRKER